jgi:hypothetical protein
MFCVFCFIVLSREMFMCKRVMYNCRRLSAQLRLTNRSYHNVCNVNEVQ